MEVGETGLEVGRHEREEAMANSVSSRFQGAKSSGDGEGTVREVEAKASSGCPRI